MVIHSKALQRHNNKISNLLFHYDSILFLFIALIIIILLYYYIIHLASKF